jgi:hypothetical protein
MPPSANQFVQVAPDSTGKKIHNLEITVMEGDGTTSTVEMQVISIADKSGNVLDFGNLEGALDRLNENIDELLFEIRLQNETNEE